MNKLPLVSIGVPIFNEERFLRESLNSLVNQNYNNIEILISDNGSNDSTPDICVEYSKKYHHISFKRFECNSGPAKNFNFVLQQSNGKYFMWASGHDLWSENYIDACVSALESDVSAVVSFGSCFWINDKGEILDKRFGHADTRGLNTISRFNTILWGNMNPVLGLIRSNSIKGYTIINMVGADLIILTQLILKGNFIHTDESKWFRREFRNEKSYHDKLKRYKSSDYHLTSTLFDRYFPLARLPYELVKSVLLSEISFRNKLMLLMLLIPSLPIRYFSGKFQ